MGRVPEGGRNFEGFGADPYLAGEAAFETVAGMQSQGVQACAKHFLNNEQEHGRRTTTSDVSDRVQHEFYLHPFLRSVQAGVASIMCSYNQINGTYACDHNDTLNTYLKGQLGFEGYVMSDWDAKHDTKSANNGLDMTMPGSIQSDGTDKYFGNRLVKAVEAGTVPRERLEDMAIRIVAAWFAVGQDQDYPEVNFDAFNRNSPANQHIDVQDDHAQLIRKIGAASTVLLKNEKGALPLVQPGTVALIGSDAGPSIRGPNWFQDRAGLDGILAQGWGSGTADYPYLVSPLEALQSRARDEHTTVSWFIEDYDLSGASQTATDKDVAIVFVAANSGEEYLTVDGNVGDRNNLTSWTNGEELVKAVASHNNNTIVVVHSVGPILMPWADHENITAIVWAGVPGQEAGSSLVDVLYGDWNPSGRLPYTIARAEQDYKTRIEWNKHEVPYDEG
jgi:beta-glucosidase